jgi:hypothetical protein
MYRIAEGCDVKYPLKRSRISGGNFAPGVFVGKEGGEGIFETEGNG